MLVLILELFILNDIECLFDGDSIIGGLTNEKLMEESKARRAIMRKNCDYLNYWRT